MDWSRETVLEFIELLERESCIWDPKNPHHNNRNLVIDAWIRIARDFSTPCTVEELKKKRNTLLTQYRDCLRKVKESMRSGCDAEAAYRPAWFAFDAIHKYMGELYDRRRTMSTDTQDSTYEMQFSHEGSSVEPKIERSLSRQSTFERSMSRDSNSQSGSDYYPVPKKPRDFQEVLIAKQESHSEDISTNHRERLKESNECDLYGQLLSQKLKILDVDDRLVLMNEIDNTVFKYMMNARKRSRFMRN